MAKNYGLDGVEEIPTGLCKSLNNTYLIVGEVPGLTSPPPPKIGRTDGWILWVDGTGNEIANKFFGTTLDDHPSGVKQLNANKYIISTDAVYLNPAFTQGSWQYNTGVVNGEAFTIIKLTSTNVKEIKSGKNSLQIYPNPANNELTILLPTENTSYSLYISNSEGKIVAQHNKLKQKQLVISTTAWQAGTYLLNCTDKVGNIWNAKAIITH